ncbi:hypothetical protein B0J17DRAFT_632189 [Rhizoctonia solani]|nr:hypothetical protein B0J17DRAFT_632189 [Rhizoctonia solani]
MLIIGILSSQLQQRNPNLMEVGESRHYEDCYFQYGDVLVVTTADEDGIRETEETVDFKLHRDILLQHSGFFRNYRRQNMLPEDHVQHPTLLEVAKRIKSTPADFHRLCRFMYPDPSAIGTLPHVGAGDIDTWRSAIQATIEFDMPDIRSYIVTKLTQDEAKFSAETLSFLKLAMSWEGGNQDLLLKCHRAFAFRRLPPPLADLKEFPDDIVRKIILVRERARSLFLDHRKLRLWIPTPSPTCVQPSACQDSIIGALIQNMTNPSPDPNRFPSIFEPLNAENICGSCQVPSLLNPLKEKLNLEIDHYLEELSGVDEEPLAPNCN